MSMKIRSKITSLIRLKYSRLVSFSIFRSRNGLITPYGSYISPKEVIHARSAQISNEISQIRRIFTPHHVGHELKRFGSIHDGGYYLVDQPFSKSNMISGGIETNNDFEIELAKLGTTGVQIDYSIDSPPNEHENLQFIQSKIVGSPKRSGEVSLNMVYEKFLNTSGKMKSLDVLKLDIEGSEWSCLKEFAHLDSFNQIVIEFHQLHQLVDQSFRSTALQVLEKLNDTHLCVFTNGNNCCGFTVIAGNPIPNVVEATFVNRNYIRDSRELTRFEIERLQVPNLPDRSKLVWF